MGERLLGGFQFASDIMSYNIMRNRDYGIPPYHKYREICSLPVPKDFDDLLHWMPEEVRLGMIRFHKLFLDLI